MSVSPISRSSLQEIIETYWNVNYVAKKTKGWEIDPK